MRTLIIAMLLAVSFPTLAVTWSGTEIVRLGNKTISGGDSMKKVKDAGGQPDTKRDLTNRFGVKLGEEWTYTNGRSTIYIDFDNSHMVTGVASSME